MTWQSPIAPGISWYQATMTDRPAYPALDSSRTTDVAIIGGGYTGLQAACHLAAGGVSVTLIDANRFGDGVSGRNGGEAVTDSRFVVRYFRKSKDGRLLFGGRESYTYNQPRDISTHPRRQIAEVYPQLGGIDITNAWGGFVGITLPRQPFVRDVMPGVTSIGGYSGHGVMLANYFGKLYADYIISKTDELKPLKVLKVGQFPGGARLRAPLLFLALSWYAFLNRL